MDHAERVAWGAKLREIRESDGLSKAELAKRIGCWPAQVAEYEKGFHIPSISRIYCMQMALGADLSELLSFGKWSSSPGGRLTLLRIKAGLNRTELARLVGMSIISITRYERNAYLPSRPTAEKIATVLKVFAADIWVIDTLSIIVIKRVNH